MDLALNNLERLIYHKTKPNQTKPILAHIHNKRLRQIFEDSAISLLPWIFKPIPFLKQTSLEWLQYIQTLIIFPYIFYFFPWTKLTLCFILLNILYDHFVLDIILHPFFNFFPLSLIFVYDNYVTYLKFPSDYFPLLLFFYIFINTH